MTSATELGAVLVLGNFRPSFIVVRTLAQLGYRTIIGFWGGEGCIEYSRYAHECWDHPAVEGNGDEFVGTLLKFLEARPDIRTIYPIAEVFVACLAEHKDKLPQNVLLVSVAPDAVRTCSDKVAMLEIAVSRGVACEEFRVALAYSDILPATEQIGYPVVIRPLTPCTWLGQKKALICADAQEIHRTLPSWPAGQRALLIQKLANGPRHNIYFAASNGRIISSLETRILRTDHQDGTGYAVDGVTVPRTPALHEDCTKLADALCYTGIGLAQFIVNQETGQRCFLELNPRVSGSHAISEALGQNLTRTAILLAKGADQGEFDTAYEYQVGIRYAWTYGDLRGLKGAIAAGNFGIVEVISWLLQACWTAIRADVHMTWVWKDPLPSLILFLRQIPGFNR